ncbi:neutral zinc metallopeptidase [Acrocarpospora catenulata]|uniref:neutral zinc metallopeptidase n=1 Tax=Acrocarpospora catenulata TaxID=2836182 RepID=UPI001BDA4791|nr:neutral zinc metallopeptidase [Acrocarpospora catenulata]
MPPRPQGPFFPQGGRPVPQGPYGPPRHIPTNWRPPRRKSSAGVIVGGILGLLAAVFTLLIVGANLADRARPQPDPVSPIALPTSTGGARPTSAPTPTQPAAPLDRSLKTNTVYKAGALPRTRCPGGNASIYNHAQLKKLILKTGACMDRAWKSVLDKVGIPFTPPKFAIVARSGRGACGDFPQRGNIVPYYCPANQTIYASTSAMVNGSGAVRGYGKIVSWHGGITGIMAHEYGHHVQLLSGLAQTRWELTQDTSAESQRLAISRRFELQANCFGGMFMRSVAASYPIPAAQRGRLFYLFSNVGDWPGRPRDHGTPANSGAWFRQGWQRQQAYQCNTWAVRSATVS